MVIGIYPSKSYDQIELNSLKTSIRSKADKSCIVVRSVFVASVFLIFSSSLVAQTFCGRAKTFISELPFICTSRQSWSEGLLADGYEFQRTLGHKDVFYVAEKYPLPATLVSLFNSRDELLMAQYIFPANTSGNAYRRIREQIDDVYGSYKRSKGSELEKRFEFIWFMQDGVRIRFQRKSGQREARLTFNLPHKTKAYLRRQAATESGAFK